MSRTLMLIPIRQDVGLTTVAAGLVRAIDSCGLRVNFFKPIAQRELLADNQEHSTAFIGCQADIDAPPPVTLAETKKLLGRGQWDELLEEVVASYQTIENSADIIIVEGLVTTNDQTYATRVNMELAKALDAEIILVSALDHQDIDAFQNQVIIATKSYGGLKNDKILGLIVNKAGSVEEPQDDAIAKMKLFKTTNIKFLGAIPQNPQLTAPRVSDMAAFLDAKIIYPGEIQQRRILHVTICARSMSHMINALQPGTLIITPGDRSDIILATCMAALNGVHIAALLLTGEQPPEPQVLAFCEQAIKTGLPILATPLDTYRTALKIPQFDVKVPLDDSQRIEAVKDFVAQYINTNILQQLATTARERRLSPAAFRYQLINNAHQAAKTIVLPEGNEPRTIQAAIICTERQIAHCVLLGKRDEIQRIAEHQGLKLPDEIKIVAPESIRKKYIKPLVELRKHKGMTELIAEEQLRDNIVLATMMLQLGDVDGLVSGAIHTTANTIRPALQLIKTAPDAKIVSSVFFMCLPEQVLVYGDCAVNPEPDADQLADIAIQSADSAKIFGIEPRVAMISYSTGSSGAGKDVEKVRNATAKVKEKRPDIIIDGPLQYDAALNKSVAQSKAPDSPVAGKATVVIFPDLNTGNTTYKAVQRSADVICMGPMLQGLNKPVNDLSRGALVDDIVFTIALTAIQGTK